MQRRDPGPFYLSPSTDFGTQLLRNAISCLCRLPFINPSGTPSKRVWLYKDARNGCDTCSPPRLITLLRARLRMSAFPFFSVIVFHLCLPQSHASVCLFPFPDCHFSFAGPLAQVEALKEENDSLRCQLDAYRNEVELLKQEQGKAQPQRSEEDATRQQQLSFLQQALQGMQKVRTHTPSKTERVGTHLCAVLCHAS